DLNEATLMMPFQEKEKVFSAKAVLCHANEDPPDKLYLAYYLFGGASARQQNAAFHEKVTKKIKKINLHTPSHSRT
ncbi:MAG: hypothetical protein K2F95_02145, partial [Alistipes sp.]|nr:hypothetical protein [Alistipes sp.]